MELSKVVEERDYWQKQATRCGEDNVARLLADITDLKDRLKNGIRYDEERNEYILVWTAQEIEQARIEADKIYAKLVEPEVLAEGKDDSV